MTSAARQPIGLVLALLALTAQLALGASVPRVALLPLGFGIICHTHDDTPSAPVHHLPDCVFCPLCTALGAPPPTLVASPLLPPPRLAPMAASAVLPAAPAPPLPVVRSAQPRGPPSLA